MLRGIAVEFAPRQAIFCAAHHAQVEEDDCWRVSAALQQPKDALDGGAESEVGRVDRAVEYKNVGVFRHDTAQALDVAGVQAAEVAWGTCFVESTRR